MNVKIVSALFALLTVASSVYVNEFDQKFDFECHPTETISRVYSIHDNGHEDRRFDFTCRNVSGDMAGTTTKCHWTDYVNTYDNLVHFSCENNYYMTGMGSVHDNGKEDRKFRFYCCEASNYHELDCNLSGWVNDYDKLLDFNVHPGYVMKGMISEHDNGPEDRRFDFQTCRFIKLYDEVLVG